MELYVLGTGRQLNKERIHNTAFVLDCGKKYMIDCPWAPAYVLGRCGLSLDDIDRVIITHAHSDHVGSLETVLNCKEKSGKKARLYATRPVYEGIKRAIEPSVSGRMDENMRPYEKRFEEFVDYVELEPRKVLEEDGISIAVRENLHAVPAIGLKMSDGKRTFAYSGDTKYDPRLLEELKSRGSISDAQYEDLIGFLWGADFIVHSAGNNEALHTDAAALEALPENIRKKIRIAHRKDELDTTLEQLEDFGKYRV